MVERIFLGNKKAADFHRAKQSPFGAFGPKVLGSDGVFDNLYLEEASKREWKFGG